MLCGVLLLLLAACGGSSPSTLNPQGPGSSVVAQLWWVLFGIAVVVCAVVIGMLLLAMARRRRATPSAGSRERFVLVLGFVIPAVILAGVFGFGLRDMGALARPSSPPALTVQVIGHQWWWEVRYPGSGAVTANEIHIPAGRTVRLQLGTMDVIHSFWVPQLTPKRDLMPHQTNTIFIKADHPGRYRGQCAEYCGAQHANMAFFVVAQPPSRFGAWLADQTRPARAPLTAQERLGRQVLVTGTCATCHTVRGTTANGTIGPDLTHVGSRSTLAAGTVPNDVGHMSGWIANSQSIKPGNKMPPQSLSPRQLKAVVAYLQSLD